MSEAVVGGPFLRIAQHAVSFRGFFKLIFRILIVGIAVGTAILPALSRQIRAGDESAANATQNQGLELALFLTLPAAAALAVISEPILSVLFQRGRFDAAARQPRVKLS